ncbi:zinc-dependent metalloprotease [Novosphingobium sp. AP12]|uniref:zinc-dependent metalloprotease n=1 Tax=Novosphingobium sp. AP12 TaxID=1144305 RepID=UPI00030FD8D6|nr:zinc-dependent metalloprotease [Novosphingobium sp. AP12]
MVRTLLVAASALSLLSGTGATAAPVRVTASPDGALLPVEADAQKGKVMLVLPAADADGVSGRYLFTQAIKTGLGSAAIRIDRGMQGDTKVLAFRRMGGKVAVVFENPRYRATGDAGVAKGARASFPFSTVAMLEIVGDAPDGGPVKVDLTPLLMADSMDLGGALAAGAKGYKLSEKLSAVDTGSIKVFPRNIELETVQTFAADSAGHELDILAPDGRAVSFTVHSSLVALPEPGFKPRRFDIRSGAHATQVYDFGTPLGSPMLVEYANRFRLEKTDPAAARSPVKKPIVFYIDSAAPEPIRSALADGVRWWADAFDAAGFIDAFKVEILPPGVDPQDVRYSMVNWTDRQNRSWSYGGGVIDPRTGEIIKGNVVLGALRVRQDITIFEGLVGTAQNGDGGPNDPVRAALARISQLGAHEVGHSIGFVHNFKASLQDRASVMDYPGPKVDIAGRNLSLADAYASGIGRWDKFTVDWLYGEPSPSVDPDTDAASKAEAAQKAGMLYGTDIDGRASDLAVPGVNMWTEGQDTPADLAHTLEVRRIALQNFGPRVLLAGEPLSNLRRKFVPIWLFHRYSIDATGKLVGGVRYDYAVAGDGKPVPSPVPAAEQLAAMDAMVATLSERELTVPGELSMVLSSGTSARDDAEAEPEVLLSAGSAVFDPLVAAQVAAQVTLDSLLAPARLTRLHIQHGYDAGQPGVMTLLDKLRPVIGAHDRAVTRRISQATLLAIASASRDPATPADVAAVLDGFLKVIAGSFAKAKRVSEEGLWQLSMAATLGDPARLEAEIDKQRRPKPDIPAGMPIGDTGWFDDVLPN